MLVAGVGVTLLTAAAGRAAIATRGPRRPVAARPPRHAAVRAAASCSTGSGRARSCSSTARLRARRARVHAAHSLAGADRQRRRARRRRRSTGGSPTAGVDGQSVDWLFSPRTLTTASPRGLRVRHVRQRHPPAAARGSRSCASGIIVGRMLPHAPARRADRRRRARDGGHATSSATSPVAATRTTRSATRLLDPTVRPRSAVHARDGRDGAGRLLCHLVGGGALPRRASSRGRCSPPGGRRSACTCSTSSCSACSSTSLEGRSARPDSTPRWCSPACSGCGDHRRAAAWNGRSGRVRAERLYRQLRRLTEPVPALGRPTAAR